MSPTGPQKTAIRPLGPQDIEAAKEEVRIGIRLRCPVTHTHRVAVIEGIETPRVRKAVATYLFGAGILQAVRSDLSLAAEFLGVHAPLQAQLRNDLFRTIGPNNEMDREFKESRRNPWIAEGIGHLLLSISIHCPNLGPPGQLAALTPMHASVTEQGLDLVGLHEEDEGLMGLCVGEIKATSQNASGRVNEASALFAAIDNLDWELSIRQKVILLSSGRDANFQARLPEGFWRARRAYLPIVAYCTASRFVPDRSRRALGELAIGPERVRLLCIALEDYDAFFDSVADDMRGEIERFRRNPDVR